MAEKNNFSTKLYEACSNDELRPLMMCIHFMNGFAYASDAHIAIKQSLEYHSVINPELLDGKSLHKDNYKAIMTFDFAEANDDGISCRDADGRVAFFEYFDMKGQLQPDFDSVFKQKPIKQLSFIGFDPTLFVKLSKALYAPDKNIRVQFTGIDSHMLIDVVGIENQEALLMPLILEASLF